MEPRSSYFPNQTITDLTTHVRRGYTSKEQLVFEDFISVTITFSTPV